MHLQKKTRKESPGGSIDNVLAFTSRYSCHSHPRTSGAPCILCVLSHRSCRCPGTIRGWRNRSSQQ